MRTLYIRGVLIWMAIVNVGISAPVNKNDAVKEDLKNKWYPLPKRTVSQEPNDEPIEPQPQVVVQEDVAMQETANHKSQDNDLTRAQWFSGEQAPAKPKGIEGDDEVTNEDIETADLIFRTIIALFKDDPELLEGLINEMKTEMSELTYDGAYETDASNVSPETNKKIVEDTSIDKRTHPGAKSAEVEKNAIQEERARLLPQYHSLYIPADIDGNGKHIKPSSITQKTIHNDENNDGDDDDDYDDDDVDDDDSDSDSDESRDDSSDNSNHILYKSQKDIADATSEGSSNEDSESSENGENNDNDKIPEFVDTVGATTEQSNSKDSESSENNDDKGAIIPEFVDDDTSSDEQDTFKVIPLMFKQQNKKASSDQVHQQRISGSDGSDSPLREIADELNHLTKQH